MKISLLSIVLPIVGSIVLPLPALLAWLAISVLLDFATGISKSIYHQENRTSSQYRETVTKLFQYGGVILVSIIICSIALNQKSVHFYDVILSHFNDTLLGFLIFIEVTSIFENIYAIDKVSKFSTYFIKPMLAVLTFSLENFFKLGTKTQTNNDK